MNDDIIEVAPIRDQVADILRRKIISGEYEAGQKLSERQISGELNISTTPVKEAFRLLQAEGLLYTLPRRGSFVAAKASDHVYQIMILRSSIDGAAAYLAARYINDETYAKIKAPLDNAAKLIEAGCEDFQGITYHNNMYHAAIREASGNEQIVKIGSNLKEIDNSLRYALNTDKAGIIVRHKEHEHILELIRQAKAEEAEAVMIAHIRRSNSKLFQKNRES